MGQAVSKSIGLRFRAAGRSAAMKRIDLMKVNRAAAFMYGMGVWTTLGLVIYTLYPQLFKRFEARDPNEPLPDNIEVKVYKYGNFTITQYQEKDGVPIATRIYNNFKLLTGGSVNRGDDK